MSVGTPFIARLLVCILLVYKALGRLILTHLPSAAFILLSFCRIMTSCTESPMTTKSPFVSSLILKILRLGCYCLNSPISVLQFLNFSSMPLRITRIEFCILGLGRYRVPKGGSKEPGLGWLFSVGEFMALRFLRLRVTSVNLSS